MINLKTAKALGVPCSDPASGLSGMCAYGRRVLPIIFAAFLTPNRDIRRIEVPQRK